MSELEGAARTFDAPYHSWLLRLKDWCLLLWWRLSMTCLTRMQAEAPEEDMDVRGGGAAAEDARIVKPGYESDDEAEEKRWPGHHTSAAPMHLVRRSTCGAYFAVYCLQASGGHHDLSTCPPACNCLA